MKHIGFNVPKVTLFVTNFEDNQIINLTMFRVVASIPANI